MVMVITVLGMMIGMTTVRVRGRADMLPLADRVQRSAGVADAVFGRRFYVRSRALL